MHKNSISQNEILYKHQTQHSILCLMGPTCSGKTALALTLSEHFPVEIISVDSAMVYRGMNIGTAKPTAEVLAKYPHHLVDIRDPHQIYSAGIFCDDAKAAIDTILVSGKIPLLVGGTMLYFKAFLQGLSLLPAQSPKVRTALAHTAEEKGWPFLYAQLQTCDPAAALKISQNDKQRIQRALEVYTLTGKPISWFWNEKKTILPYRTLELLLTCPDRKKLHQRIEVRFDEMLEQGLIDEVKILQQNPLLNLNSPAMRSINYQETWRYLLGEYSLKELREKATAATRQLAKHQITWLNQWKTGHRIALDDSLNQISAEIRQFLQGV